jgi:hypothetical protein
VTTLALVLLSMLGGQSTPEGELPQETGEPPAEPQGGAGVSPVELIPRVEVRHSFVRMPNGVSANITTTELDLQIFPRMLLRYELPALVVKLPNGQMSGLGDVKLSTLVVLFSDRTHLVGLLGGLVLDTATQPKLGEGKQQIQFGAGAAIKPRSWWLAYSIVQEQLSVGGDDARPDVNQLTMGLGNIVFGRRFTWFKLDLAASMDFPGPDGRFFGTFELGSLLIGRVGLFMRSGTQLLGQRQVDYSLAAGVRYLFRLESPKPRS